MNHQQARIKRWPSVIDPLIWVWLALFLFYLTWVLIRPQYVFWSLDEGGKYLYIQNVFRTNSPMAPLLYPGRALDPKLNFVPLFFYQQSGDQIYSWWPVGFPLITLPFYAWFGWIGLYVLPAAAGAAVASLTGCFVRYLAPDDWPMPVAAALMVGLATPLFFYATMFWEHSLSVFFLMLALWAILVGDRTNQVRWVVIAGVAASLATFLRTEQLFGALGLLTLLTWRRWRWALIMLAIFGLIALAWLWLNQQLMGNFISRQWGQDGTALTTSFFPGLQEAGVRFVPFVLFNAPRVIAFALSDRLLLVGTGLTMLCVILPFWRRAWPLLALAYVGLGGVCSWVLLQPTGYRSIHGLLLIAPQIVGFPWLYTHLHWRILVRRNLDQEDARPEKRLLFASGLLAAVSCFTLLGFLARSWLAAGGQQWGPRYLLVLYPILVCAAVAGLQITWKQAASHWIHAITVAYLLLILIGFGYELRGQQAVWKTVHNYQLTQQAMAKLAPVPTLTDCTWLPLVIPELYWRGKLFAQTTHSLDEWKTLMASQGITHHQSLKMDMCLSSPLDEIEQMRQANPTGISLEQLP